MSEHEEVGVNNHYWSEEGKNGVVNSTVGKLSFPDLIACHRVKGGGGGGERV